MWDNPKALDSAARALCALAAVLAAYAGLAALVRQPVFALREVRIEDGLAHVTPEQIERVVARDLRGNFFTLDLAALRRGFEKLPWVRKADLRRRWPDRLEVRLEEHVPLARWGAQALVNTHGEVFEAALDGKLPVFNGPPGTAKEIAIQYEFFRRALGKIDQVPAQIQISARRAWEVRLAGGMTLELGRESVEARLDRFVAAYDRTLGRMQHPTDYVDLRYPNGFAVRASEPNPGSGEGGRAKRAS